MFKQDTLSRRGQGTLGHELVNYPLDPECLQPVIGGYLVFFSTKEC